MIVVGIWLNEYQQEEQIQYHYECNIYLLYDILNLLNYIFSTACVHRMGGLLYILNGEECG
jgi:hypothetical protein